MISLELVHFSKRSWRQFDLDYDGLATALRRGRSSSERHFPKILGRQVDDIRSFLDSLDEMEDIRDCYIR